MNFRRALLTRFLQLPKETSLAPQHRSVEQAELKEDPIPAAQIIAGNPIARSAALVCSGDTCFTGSLWTCTPGTFRWFYRSDEIIHVMQGHVLVEPEQGGEPFEIRGGDVVYFASDTSAVWEVRSEIRKIALVRSAPNDPLGRLRSKLGRIARQR